MCRCKGYDFQTVYSKWGTEIREFCSRIILGDPGAVITLVTSFPPPPPPPDYLPLGLRGRSRIRYQFQETDQLLEEFSRD